MDHHTIDCSKAKPPTCLLLLNMSIPVEVPFLRFEVKPTCSALKNGRCVLKELSCTNRFGIKIARIKGIDAEKGRTPRPVNLPYPDAHDELKAGALGK